MILKILFGIISLIVIASAYKNYEDYRVYDIVPNSDEQVQILLDLQKQGYEFWTDIIAVDNNVKVMVSPVQNKEFTNYSTSVGLNIRLTIRNVQELIDAQKKQAQISRSTSLGSFDWNNYHTLQEIHSWLDELQELYPGVVTTVTIGTSFEGRPIKGVIIDFKSNQREGTPLIGMIEGGIHAREWISPATVTWIIKEFLTSDDPDVRFMAEAFVWHIFPVTNPDGYSYTFSENRMWRKNRNPTNHVNCTSNDDLGNGIDLNRNFNYLWMTIGASANPCQETYAGPAPSSELEAQAIINHVTTLKQSGNMIFYFAFHSYSQMILVPYSHVTGYDVLHASNYADMYEIAIRGAEKLTAVHGTHYEVGTSAEILYAVSGSSFDWVKGVAEIPIVYLFELRDLGQYGFLLPTEEIIPNNEEIMACLVEMEKATRQLNYYSASNTVFGSVLLIVIGILFSFISQ